MLRRRFVLLMLMLMLMLLLLFEFNCRISVEILFVSFFTARLEDEYSQLCHRDG